MRPTPALPPAVLLAFPPFQAPATKPSVPPPPPPPATRTLAPLRMTCVAPPPPRPASPVDAPPLGNAEPVSPRSSVSPTSMVRTSPAASGSRTPRRRLPARPNVPRAPFMSKLTLVRPPDGIVQVLFRPLAVKVSVHVPSPLSVMLALLVLKTSAEQFPLLTTAAWAEGAVAICTVGISAPIIAMDAAIESHRRICFVRRRRSRRPTSAPLIRGALRGMETR